MSRASAGSPELDDEAARLLPLLRPYDPGAVFQWLYPSIAPKQLLASMRAIDGEFGSSHAPKTFAHNWQPLRTALELVDAIASKRRVSAPIEAVVNGFRRLTSPYFNWAPCACLLTLQELRGQCRSPGSRRLLRALQKHYVAVLDLGAELGSVDGFHDWLKCATKTETRSFLARLAGFQRSAGELKTRSGAPSKRPVNSLFHYLDGLARTREASPNPPTDAAEASWIVISSSVFGLDTNEWKKWRLVISSRTRHIGVGRIIDQIEPIERREGPHRLESFLRRYVGDL